MKKQKIDLPVFAPACFHGIRNDIDLMQTFLLDHETAETHFTTATKRALSIIDDYLKPGIKMIGIGGDFAWNTPLISSEAYKNFIVPEVLILLDYIRNIGGLSINATDGNLWSVIDDFLINCGTNGYMEIDFCAGIDFLKRDLFFHRDTVVPEMTPVKNLTAMAMALHDHTISNNLN